MDNQFRSKYGPWALVAGASEGLGAEFATQLARRGLNLALVARRADRLRDLAARLAETYRIATAELALDLSEPGAAEQIAQATAQMDIGLLVYNAAFSAVGPFLQRPVADHLKEIDTNVRTPLALVHGLGRRFETRGRGGVILMSSLSAFQGSAYISNYAATKAYNQLVGEGLWAEWKPKGVDVLVCTAGSIRTPKFEASQPKATGGFSDMVSEPAQVVSEALAALGKRAYIIPGWNNRLASFVMRHLLPRQAAIRMMANILEGKYPS